ncbi:MAG TPA: DUF6152 family protein [Steroidobacteraceae bacterium]|jgi:hypothetical protein|nr:DUF6152 family protein [Steroidobacteraceae bacterium]
MKRGLLIALAVFVLAAPLGVGAHHSTANFDHSKTVTVHGVVKYFAFTNPHSFMDLEVQNEAGEWETYKVFTVGKVLMKRYGWTDKDVTPGDKVTVSGNPDRHNPQYLYLTHIVFASGKTWSRGAIPD